MTIDLVSKTKNRNDDSGFTLRFLSLADLARVYARYVSVYGEDSPRANSVIDEIQKRDPVRKDSPFETEEKLRQAKRYPSRGQL